jgi:DNA-cytosine methyltransferase
MDLSPSPVSERKGAVLRATPGCSAGKHEVKRKTKGSDADEGHIDKKVKSGKCSKKEHAKRAKDGRSNKVQGAGQQIKAKDVCGTMANKIGRTLLDTKTADTHNERFVKRLKKKARTDHDQSDTDGAHCQDACVTMGSDCSGYGSDMIALKLLGVKPKLVFLAEKDDGKRELLFAVHRLLDHGAMDRTIIYKDIKDRINATAPYVDLFVSGAPCPAFSSAGKRLGLRDLQDRGVTIFYSLDYVRAQRPRVVILENVAGLTQGSSKELFHDILDILKDLGYTVEWSILNTKDHGIPHSRPRVYVVAIRTKFLSEPFTFPGRVVAPAVDSFLDIDDMGEEPPRSQIIVNRNINTAKKKYGKDFTDKYMWTCVPGRHLLTR